MWKCAIPACVILLGSPLLAQHHAPARFSFSPGLESSARTRTPHTFLLGAPFWADAYYAPSTPPPAVVVVQAPAPAPPVQAEEPRPASPLLIEWQGDRYVRRTSAAVASTRNAQPDYVTERTQSREKTSQDASPRPETPPTIFVFRDGHREESSDYSIISGVIYARGDYWTSGSWSKQIPVAKLDLPATQRANQERGVAFRLPSAPNEVVTRP